MFGQRIVERVRKCAGSIGISAVILYCNIAFNVVAVVSAACCAERCVWTYIDNGPLFEFNFRAIEDGGDSRKVNIRARFSAQVSCVPAKR